VNVVLRGVRGSLPSPRPETARYGGNTSCVEVRLSDDSTLVLDAGTGMRALGNALLDQVPNPYYGFITVGVLAQPTVQRGYLLRPTPAFNGVSVTNASWGNSNYHALQTRFEKRFSKGFSMLASYSWSKTMTDGADGPNRTGSPLDTTPMNFT